MPRDALVENVSAMLRDAGFVVSDPCVVRPRCFDIAARRGDDVILVKLLVNADALNDPTGVAMRRLGGHLGATPLVFALRTRDDELDPGVVYFRHGVPVISPDTATELFVHGQPPLIYAAPGGLYVNIDADILADEREDAEMSLGQLASELGVSRRTVSKYEDGMNASIEVATRLEGLFGTGLTSPVDVLGGGEDVREVDAAEAEPTDETDERATGVVTVLRRVGLTVHPTRRAPFSAVGEDAEADRDVLSDGSELNETAEKRARIMASLGRITRTRSVYFVDRSSRESIDGTAIVERDEAASIDDRDEFRDLVRERADAEA
jgi:putative transcriptional regulator